MKKIVLASASPRRKEILSITGLKFFVSPGDYEEDLGLKKEPHELAKFLSRKKAEAVINKHGNSILITADTFISCDNAILGKPSDQDEAVRMLKMLSGRAHSVITGYTIIDTSSGKRTSRSVETLVYFKKLTIKEIKAYVRSGEPMDKAGAYAIQGLGSLFIEKIEGDYFNVVGLPLCSLTESLKKFGVNVL